LTRANSLTILIVIQTARAGHDLQKFYRIGLAVAGARNETG